MEQGGKIANNAGKRLKGFVKKTIEGLGYEYIESERFMPFSEITEQLIFSEKVVVGETIYQTERRADFILRDPEHKGNLIIECKWQGSGGTVDEKYPYLWFNIEKSKIDTIIILDGGGYKKGAEDWLKQQAQQGYLKAVYSMSEFQDRANKKSLSLVSSFF